MCAFNKRPRCNEPDTQVFTQCFLSHSSMTNPYKAGGRKTFSGDEASIGSSGLNMHLTSTNVLL